MSVNDEYAIFIDSPSPVISCSVRIISEGDNGFILTPPLDVVTMIRLKAGAHVISLESTDWMSFFTGSACQFEPANINFYATANNSGVVG